MNLKEYQIESKRTCPALGSEAIDLSHMVMGMFSEYSELMDASSVNDVINIAEEIADFYWYLSNYCTFRGYDLNFINSNTIDFYKNEDYNPSYLYNLSLLQDSVKKFLAYGKEIDRDKEVNIIQCLISNMRDSFINKHNINLSLALRNNIDKLRIRYPEKFTKENAINRELDKERKELEKS